VHTLHLRTGGWGDATALYIKAMRNSGYERDRIVNGNIC